MKNKKMNQMELYKSNTINNWNSMKFLYKFKNLEEPNYIRGIFLGVYNTSNIRVIKI